MQVQATNPLDSARIQPWQKFGDIKSNGCPAWHQAANALVLLPGLIICLKLCSRDGEHIAHLLCGHPLDVSVHIDSRTGDGQYAHHHGRLMANDESSSPRSHHLP